MNRRSHKHFFPTILFSLLSWGVLFYFFFFVDPAVLRDFPFAGAYFLFFLFLFFSLFLTLSLLFSHVRRGLFFSLGVVIFLYLRLYGLGYFLNFFLLATFLVILELALSTRR